MASRSKKYALSGFFIIYLAFLTACGSSTGIAPPASPTPTVKATATPTPTPSPTPFPTPSPTPTSVKPWVGKVTDWANVHAEPRSSSTLIATYPPETRVMVYATVRGETVWGGIATWYRISGPKITPLFIYGGLLVAAPLQTPTPPSPEKVIMVSLSQQWFYAFENRSLVHNAPATTGRPELPSPAGSYTVQRKLSPTVFYSPWPPGSPYYYPPTEIAYALQWRSDGYFLHDSWWRSIYGPGTNVWHEDPEQGWQTGTHGCITIPLDDMKWLYSWAEIGTIVQVIP